MDLSAGSVLGVYEIVSPIGAGGMGEVYRARDQQLDRIVALKILPGSFASDPDRLKRFEREARTLAALNHPHIAAIHGIEEAAGLRALVMEFVEGEDLSRRLARGPIPLGEALSIARQMADALEAAHEQGIIHRDLKPANIRVSDDERVKVLDFGLAKVISPGDSAPAQPATQAPTQAPMGTEAGVILGTSAYMSPEQASAERVDTRTDVWSFGVVLFEMLTGRPPFSGETTAEILASILKEEPPLGALPPSCPPALSKLLRRCLKKRRRERLQHIGDARLELEELQAAGKAATGADDADDGVAAGALRRRWKRERRLWAGGLIFAAGLAAALAFLLFTAPPESQPVTHLMIDPPSGVEVGTALGFTSLPAVSPDGRHVVFVGRPRRGPPQLWIRPLDTTEVRMLAGTEGASSPFWSPGGRQIAFAAEGVLRKLTLDGGKVERICVLPAAEFAGGTWNETDTIVFSSGHRGLFTVEASGGEVQPLTTLDEPRGEQRHWAPRFLPDGRHLLFGVSSTQDESLGVYVASIEAPEGKRRLLPDDRRAAYASGHLLFVRGATLFAQPFELGDLEVSGQAIRVAENVGSWELGRLGVFGVSPSGVLAYLGRRERDVQLTWFDRQGRRLGTLGEPGRYNQISLSPDGRHVAAETRDDRGYDLWVIDVSRGVASPVTNDARSDTDPVWSPDGEELLFARHSEGGPHLFRKSLRRGTPPTPVLETLGEKWPEAWSPHGDTVLYQLKGSLWALSLAEQQPPEPVVSTGSGVDEAQLSPDGNWLAYTSDLSGEWETYIEPFRKPGGRVRVSVNGGGQPKWRADGKELFFVSRRNVLTAVPIEQGADGLELGRPIELFEIPIVQRPQLDDYAVSSDGLRFLVKVPADGTAPDRIHVVTNWTSLLE